MTLRKTGTCEACGATLYGDEYGAAGHNCPAVVTAQQALSALMYMQLSGGVTMDANAAVVRKYIHQTIARGEGD